MKFALVLLVCALAQGVVGQIPVDGSHTLWDPVSAAVLYQGDPNFPNEPILPFVNEEKLCALVGFISGCSGCELGTLGLCKYLLLSDPVVNRKTTCVPTKVADVIIGTTVGPFAIRSVGHWCPAEAKHAPIIDSELSLHYWDPETDTFEPRFVSLEETSLIHNSFHDMAFGDVPHKPWAVDRTSFYATAGALRQGAFVPLTAIPAGKRDGEAVSQLNYPFTQALFADCADLNSHEFLIERSRISFLVQGVLSNQREKYCLGIILGAYLSTRCPEYGRATSGISYSLFVRMFGNCVNGAFISPTVLIVGPGQLLTANTFGLPVVPDDTPYALTDIPIMPNGLLQHLLDMDDVPIEEEDVKTVYHNFLP